MALKWNPTTKAWESDLNAQGVSASAPAVAPATGGAFGPGNPWTAPTTQPGGAAVPATAPMNPSANVSPAAAHQAALPPSTTVPAATPPPGPVTTPPATGTAATTPAAAGTPINPATYKPPSGQTTQAFFASLTQGMPVAEAPGKVWYHTGSGWEWRDAGATGGTGAGTGTGTGAATGGLGSGGSSISVTGAGGTSGVATTPGGTTTGTAPTTPLGSTVSNPLNDALRAQVLGLLGQDINGANINDPDLAPQADAYGAARERARRQQHAAVMERLGGQGAASSGAADLATQQGFETAGQDTAAFNAGLVGDKLDDRRQMLTSAIQTAAQLGMNEEAANLSRQLSNLNAQTATMQLGATVQGQQLQSQIAQMDTNTRLTIANLDAQLRREGYSTTERLASMDTELRRYGIDVQGNLGLLNAVISLMGMDQQNTQFNQSLGATLGMFGSNFNNGLITNLLNP